MKKFQVYLNLEIMSTKNKLINSLKKTKNFPCDEIWMKSTDDTSAYVLGRSYSKFFETFVRTLENGRMLYSNKLCLDPGKFSEDMLKKGYECVSMRLYTD